MLGNLEWWVMKFIPRFDFIMFSCLLCFFSAPTKPTESVYSKGYCLINLRIIIDGRSLRSMVKKTRFVDI